MVFGAKKSVAEWVVLAAQACSQFAQSVAQRERVIFSFADLSDSESILTHVHMKELCVYKVGDAYLTPRPLLCHKSSVRHSQNRYNSHNFQSRHKSLAKYIYSWGHSSCARILAILRAKRVWFSGPTKLQTRKYTSNSNSNIMLFICVNVTQFKFCETYC